MPRQANTKEKIISSAFLLYRKMTFKEFSLSDVAKASGISKTAIFRHFTNKAELLATMTERFFESFAEFVKKMEVPRDGYDLETIQKLIDLVFEFEKEHPGYFEYYIQALMGDAKICQRMNGILENARMTSFSKKKIDVGGGDVKSLAKTLVPAFIGITILNFLIECEKSFEPEELESKSKNIRKRLAKMIYEGFGKEQNPLLPERKKELDRLCKVKLGKDENRDRFFAAFLNAIQKNEGLNVTVEDIANELGMTKSSVYSFFVNKTDYMKNMMRQETEFFSEILQEKCMLAENNDERLYILLATEMNYFGERPEVVLLHLYFIYNDVYSVREDVSLLSAIFTARFGLDNEKQAFLRWASVLIVSSIIVGKKYKFPAAWREYVVSIVYEFIECGTKNAFNN